MGRLRLLVETTLREVVLLLHREQLASNVITRVANRLAQLQRDVVDCELYQESKGIDPYEANGACYDIVTSLIHRVVNVEIPQRTVRTLEDEMNELKQKVVDAEKERDAALAQLEDAKLRERRHADAHTYALHCYFREVHQLRQVIAADGNTNHNNSSGNALTNNKPLASGLSPSASFASSVYNTPSSSPHGDLSPKHLGVGDRVGSLHALRAQAVNNNTNSKHVTSNVQLGETVAFFEAPMVTVVRDAVSPSCSGLLDVTQKYHTDAIFDYEKYLDLARSDQLGWEARYQQLNDDFNSYTVQVEKDKMHQERLHKEAIRRQQERYSLLQQRFEREIRRGTEAKLLVAGAARKYREDRAALKGDIQGMRKGLEEVIKALSAQVNSLGDYNRVLVDFIKAAANYMREQSANTSGSKLEEITRFRFQRSLVPDPSDTVNMREAKLYWRRNEMSTLLFTTVMEHRQVMEDKAESLRTVQELRHMVRFLQQENYDLISAKAAYAFVGLNSLIHQATTSSVPPALASSQITPSATPETISPVSLGLNIVSEKPVTHIRTGSVLYLALPSSTAWLLGKPRLPAVVPATVTGDADAPPGVSPASSSVSTSAMAQSSPVYHTPSSYPPVLYLRLKLSSDEIDDLVHDRLFLHRLFACARDPNYYLRDDDRNHILQGWRNHCAISHRRNHRVMHHILGGLMHKHLTLYVQELLADTMRLAVATGGLVAGATREDVLSLREAVEHVREFREELEINYQMQRTQLASQLVENARWVFQHVERHVVHQLRGLYPSLPTLRASGVPLPQTPTANINPISLSSSPAGSTIPSPRSRSITQSKRGSMVRSGSTVRKDDSVDWRSNNGNMATVATQTVVSGELEKGPNRIRSARNLLSKEQGDVSSLHKELTDKSTGKYLVQSMHQFCSTTDQDEDLSFFRVESLAPPRCIVIPTTGGVGSEELNQMSIKLLTKTSLMTTSLPLTQQLEALALQIAEPKQALAVAHHPRPGSGLPLTQPMTARGTSRISSAHARPNSTLSLADNSKLLTVTKPIVISSLTAAPPLTPRTGLGSASQRPSSSARSSSLSSIQKPSRVGSAAVARITTLPPPVYEELDG